MTISRSLRSPQLFLLAIVAAVGLLSGCVTTGPGGKTSFIIISTAQEVAIGAGMAQEVEATEKVLADSLWQDYLTRVGMKIVAVSDRKDIDYHFRVIESDQINAFAAPGGYVYFYTGLLREMNSEAEMAAVMAHEISHVVARHGIKRLQTALGVAVAYELVFGGDNDRVLAAAVGMGLSLTFSGYSRDAEREADKFGIHYMVKSGYDPQGAIDMFHTLARLGSERESGVFEKMSSSHPETQERITNAKQQISSMQSPSASLDIGRERYLLMRNRLLPDTSAGR